MMSGFSNREHRNQCKIDIPDRQLAFGKIEIPVIEREYNPQAICRNAEIISVKLEVVPTDAEASIDREFLAKPDALHRIETDKPGAPGPHGIQTIIHLGEFPIRQYIIHPEIHIEELIELRIARLLPLISMCIVKKIRTGS
jgi:hypothetical protein